MGIILHKQPQLEKPDLIAGWPGIGNIGAIAINTLRGQLGAEEMGEIESWDFFYPKKVRIKASVLEELEFPGNTFYYKRLEKKDLLFFTGEEQPTNGGRVYAEGRKAYEMAGLVLDVAQKFGCRRVYTSGASVALTHHTAASRVWVVTSHDYLTREIRSFENTVLMSEIEGRGDQGSITGLNGLLLGLAKSRGFEAVCLMGEIPDYLSGAPFPYPKASKAVLEVLAKLVGVQVDYSELNEMTFQVGGIIDSIYEKLPPEIKEKIEQRKLDIPPKSEAITAEDEQWLKEHIDELFKKGGKEGDRPS